VKEVAAHHPGTISHHPGAIRSAATSFTRALQLPPGESRSRALVFHRLGVGRHCVYVVGFGSGIYFLCIWSGVLV
jgi:hypothetical protein